METKICRVCKEEKGVSEYYGCKKCRLGVTGTCKRCRIAKQSTPEAKIRRKSNPSRTKDKIRFMNQNYYRNNRDKIRENNKKWREENKEYVSQKNKEYRLGHKMELTEYLRGYYQVNKRRLRRVQKKWEDRNRDYIRQRQREYCKKNKEHLSAKRRILESEYRKNPIWRLSKNISRGIGRSLRDGKNGRHWEDLVGYTQQDLKNHLESLFKIGMNWNNYGRGGWHIDHIIPQSRFNIKNVGDEEFRRCWDLSNLQPLWEFENTSKQDRYIG